ncbi:MAG: alpha/beta hydrolase, partial [Candidatus Marinimicrobia bacterium]|nr:alpha/beta hydrolase [Candidatus Neomarinimicrobiota bacterium]
HSFGAFLASLYAAEFPENVKAMVLVAPADVLVMPSKNGGLFEQVGKLLPENLSEEYQDYLKRYFDYKNIFEKNERELSDLNLEFTKYYSAALKTKDLNMESQTTINESGGWMVLAMYFSMGKKHDYREALNEVSVPVLVIHGENDIMPVEASQLYANILPNSKLTVIKNASHFSYDEQPEEFAKIVESFLIQVSQ